MGMVLRGHHVGHERPLRAHGVDEDRRDADADDRAQHEADEGLPHGEQRRSQEELEQGLLRATPEGLEELEQDVPDVRQLAVAQLQHPEGRVVEDVDPRAKDVLEAPGRATEPLEGLPDEAGDEEERAQCQGSARAKRPSGVCQRPTMPSAPPAVWTATSSAASPTSSAISPASGSPSDRAGGRRVTRRRCSAPARGRAWARGGRQSDDESRRPARAAGGFGGVACSGRSSLIGGSCRPSTGRVRR